MLDAIVKAFIFKGQKLVFQPRRNSPHGIVILPFWLEFVNAIWYYELV